MPYVSESVANQLDVSMDPLTPGEVNYCLTRIALDWFRSTPQKYEDMAAVVAAFECAKAEFQRRVVNPYEQKKAETPTNRDPYSNE